MSDNSTDKKIHREFELERMILFSDAVFAIAITLLVIEIKFPELPANYKVSLDLFQMFAPAIVSFFGFALSFFFIGSSWARHLEMFRYLRAYDKSVIALNLFSLFFIVSLPFGTTGVAHSRPSFMFPILIYIGNLALIFISNFMLAHYIFRKKPSLSVPGHIAEKNYLYLQNLCMASGMGVTFIALLVTGALTKFNNTAISICLDVCIVCLALLRIWLKKKKPAVTGTPGF